MSQQPIRWIHALLVAAGAAYGPFGVMSLYTQLFIPCEHCRETTLWLLPAGPGIPGTGWLIHLLGRQRFPDLANLATAIVMSALFVALIASFGRLGFRWLIGAALIALLCCGLEAFMLLVIIQA